MDVFTLRRLVRVILESSDDSEDKDDKKKKKKGNLLLEPDTVKKRKKQESSTVAGSMAGGSGVITEPDMTGPGLDDGGSIDSGDGCEDIGDCKKDNEKEEKRMKKPVKLKQEFSGAAAAGGGPAMPLGAGPHYPGPDAPAVSRIKKQIDVVGRAYGGAKPPKRKKK